MCYKVYHDKKLLETFQTEVDAMDYIHKVQSQSVDWACKYEGYEIKHDPAPYIPDNIFEKKEV